jgi:large subunit ribosomal protein L17
MKHGVDGRKFGRNTSHRVAMFKNMANSVIMKEQIVTTVQKAKEARRVVDRLITLGKSGSPASRRLAFDRTRDNLVVSKLFTTLAERYKGRAGGYTRVLKMSDRRWGDAAEMAVLELVDHAEIDRKRKPKTAGAAAAAAAGKEGEGAKDPFSRLRLSAVFVALSAVSRRYLAPLKRVAERRAGPGRRLRLLEATRAAGAADLFAA